MLAKKYVVMAREIDSLSDDAWKNLKFGGYEYGVKLAEMINNGLIDQLTRNGKQVLTETFDAIAR